MLVWTVTYVNLSSAIHSLAECLSKSVWQEESRCSMHENKYYSRCVEGNGVTLALKLWLN